MEQSAITDAYLSYHYLFELVLSTLNIINIAPKTSICPKGGYYMRQPEVSLCKIINSICVFILLMCTAVIYSEDGSFLLEIEYVLRRW